MTVHLIKLSVGVESVEHLVQLQEARLALAKSRGAPGVLSHVTRHMPRRRDEVLDGGSIFWVIRGFIRARQRIVDLVETTNGEGKPACAIVLDPALIRTTLEPFRPFQGWRYLDVARAPGDASATADDGDVNQLPPEMAAELRDLGLV